MFKGLFILGFALPLLAHAGEEVDRPEPKALEPLALQALVKQLDSEDYDTRETARLKLNTAGWATCTQLAPVLRTNRDLETRTQIQGVLNAREDAQLKAWMKQARQAAIAEETRWESQDRLFKEQVTAYNTEASALKSEEGVLAHTLAQSNLDAARHELIAHYLNRVRVDREQLDREHKKRCDVHEQARALYHLSRNRLATTVDQLAFLLQKDQAVWLFDQPIEPLRWRPIFLSFARRLKLPVTFEMVDVPFETAVMQWSRLSGLPVHKTAEVGKVDEPITLRVAAMNPKMALYWICRLANLKVDVDKDKFVISPEPK